MAAPILINHRRDRQQIRRVLTDLRVRWGDLAPLSPHRELDLADRCARPAALHYAAFPRSRS